jgi:cytochrome c55X
MQAIIAQSIVVPMHKFAFGLFLIASLPVTVGQVLAASDIDTRELVRLVRQDCGSCHGMTLQGGLGTPLTPEALANKPAETLAATILYGRLGTAMPPWKTLLSEAEANWIVERLQEGFPEEIR